MNHINGPCSIDMLHEKRVPEIARNLPLNQFCHYGSPSRGKMEIYPQRKIPPSYVEGKTYSNPFMLIVKMKSSTMWGPLNSKLGL